METPNQNANTDTTSLPEKENLSPENSFQFPPTPTKKHPWFIIILIVILVSAAGYFAWDNYQLRTRLSSQQPIPTNEATTATTAPSPAPSTPPIETNVNWLDYSDDEYLYTIQYPEPTTDYYKRTMPVKQYLDNDLTEGYRLTLSMAGKSFDDFFLLIVRKKQPDFTYSKAWQATVTEGQYKSAPHLNQSTIEIDGREALLVDSLNTPYSEGKTLQVYQWVYVSLDDKYYIEIQKGKSSLTDQMLNSLTFL